MTMAHGLLRRRAASDAVRSQRDRLDLDDAIGLFEQVGWIKPTLPPQSLVIEDVDISTLERPVTSMMGPPVWRSIWYPNRMR